MLDQLTKKVFFYFENKNYIIKLFDKRMFLTAQHQTDCFKTSNLYKNISNS